MWRHDALIPIVFIEPDEIHGTYPGISIVVVLVVVIVIDRFPCLRKAFDDDNEHDDNDGSDIPDEIILTGSMIRSALPRGPSPYPLSQSWERGL